MNNQNQQSIIQNSPLFKQAQSMANGKSQAQLEETARNLCKTKGLDYNTALQMFQQMFGTKM